MVVSIPEHKELDSDMIDMMGVTIPVKVQKV